MNYEKLVKTYEALEATQSKLEKADIIAALLKEVDRNELGEAVMLILGRVFPAHAEEELGIADKTMIQILCKVSGLRPEEAENMFAEEGDLGTVAGKLLEKKKQRTLAQKTLTTDIILENLRALPDIEGKNSQTRKQERVAELLSYSTPREARYLVRTVLGDLRIGVAEGIMRDGIAKAFFGEEERTEATKAVDRAWNILSDFGRVAEIAHDEGLEGLESVRFEIGKPFHMMLAQAADSIGDVIEEYGDVGVEIKYDGIRAQIHKKGDDVWVFTRRLEDVTKQFPDVVESARKAVTADECILDAEIWALDEKGNPMPFQKLSQRIKRKYGIDELVEEVPVQVNTFDIVSLNDESLIEKPLSERRKLLEDSVDDTDTFVVAQQLVTEDPDDAHEFYTDALDMSQEGVMLKVMDSKYVFGRRVGGWYKIKPIMETLDLVIVGARWGEGKRSNWLSSYQLACRDPESGEFLECGRMATGLTEKQYDEMTETLKPLIKKKEGRDVTVKPEVIVEVGYQEIQESPKYAAGYALRFPRLIRVRTDKGIDDADTVERVERLYDSQGS